jgi:hypothetical protein
MHAVVVHVRLRNPPGYGFGSPRGALEWWAPMAAWVTRAEEMMSRMEAI